MSSACPGVLPVPPGRAGHHLCHLPLHLVLPGRCSLFKGLLAPWAVEPGLSLARLMGWSAVRTRSPAACGCVGSGFTGSGRVWIPSLRVALGQRAVQLGGSSAVQ